MKNPFQIAKSMRRLFLAALILGSVFTPSLHAQAPVRIGLSATPLISWHRPDNAAISNESIRAGFQYGMLVDWMLNESGRYTLATGVLVTMAGTSIQDNRSMVFSINDVNRLQYVEVPVSFRLTATELN